MVATTVSRANVYPLSEAFYQIIIIRCSYDFPYLQPGRARGPDAFIWVVWPQVRNAGEVKLLVLKHSKELGCPCNVKEACP